jgi:hypothetical protein
MQSYFRMFLCDFNAFAQDWKTNVKHFFFGKSQRKKEWKTEEDKTSFCSEGSRMFVCYALRAQEIWWSLKRSKNRLLFFCLQRLTVIKLKHHFFPADQCFFIIFEQFFYSVTTTTTSSFSLNSFIQVGNRA